MANNKKKSTTIPVSIQPRKITKKSIPRKKENIASNPLAPVEETPTEEEEVKKKRFTLWLDKDVHLIFRRHTVGLKGGASKYIEDLIRADLKL